MRTSTRPRSCAVHVAVLAASLAATSARAQAQAPADSIAAPAPKSPSIGAGKDGFTLKSADSAYRIKFSGYIQADSRDYLGAPKPAGAVSTTLLRRARPIVEATVNDRYTARLMLDFGGGTTVLQDGYIDAVLKPGALTLRTGKFKGPVGLERLLSATSLSFIERGLPTSLVPNREVGTQLSGDVSGGVASWAVGVFDGVVDGGSTDGDVDNGKDTEARLWLQPHKKKILSPLNGLGIGVAATTGVHVGTEAAPNLPTYKTTGQQTFFRYITSTTAGGTVVASGRERRITAQGSYTYGRVGLLGEWVRASHVVSKGGVGAELVHRSWQGAATILLTKDQASFTGVRPSSYFDPSNGHWGAVELAARVSRLEVDPDAFPTYASPSSSAQRATAIGGGINWYLTPTYKVEVNVERTRFVGGNRPDEKALLTRFQIRY